MRAPAACACLDAHGLTRIHPLLFIPISELTTNIFDGTLPAWLAALPQLSELYLGGNYFTGAVPPALGDVAARFTNMCALGT